MLQFVGQGNLYYIYYYRIEYRSRISKSPLLNRRIIANWEKTKEKKKKGKRDLGGLRDSKNQRVNNGGERLIDLTPICRKWACEDVFFFFPFSGR